MGKLGAAKKPFISGVFAATAAQMATAMAYPARNNAAKAQEQILSVSNPTNRNLDVGDDPPIQWLCCMGGKRLS